jgi:hypothetical protein
VKTVDTTKANLTKSAFAAGDSNAISGEKIIGSQDGITGGGQNSYAGLAQQYTHPVAFVGAVPEYPHLMITRKK